MKIELIEVSNYRCFSSFSLKTGGESVFLVSENAAGKTSLLSGIAKALGKDRYAAETDFGDKSKPLEIVLTLSGFEPADQAFFPKELAFKGKPTLRIGYRGVWNASEGECDGTVGFPDHNWKSATREQRDALRLLVLPAHRDPARLLQLGAAKGFLAELVSKQKLAAPLGAAGAEIAKALQNLAAVPEIASVLSAAEDGLGRLIPGVSTGALGIGYEGASNRDILGEFQVLLAHGGAPLPLARQSNGVGQLAVFVFALTSLAQDPKAILVVDEPEISLHPQAQRALVTAIRALPNQSLIATHSSNILDRADPRTVIRLNRKGPLVTPMRAAGLSDPEADRLARVSNSQTTEACFGRRVVLVEGYSDRVAILRLARRIGRDLDAEGTTVVSLDGGSGIGSYLRLFGSTGFGLDVFGLCDQDKEAFWIKELQKAGFSAVVDSATMRAAGFFVCVKDLEHEFIRALGISGAQGVISAEGEAAAFSAFQKQPAQSGKPIDEQLRKFLHNEATRWAAPLVDALVLTAVPGPLDDLFKRIR